LLKNCKVGLKKQEKTGKRGKNGSKMEKKGIIMGKNL
jgi:hypothetical protein